MNAVTLERPITAVATPVVVKSPVTSAPANDSELFFVFVYGTLKRGYGNNRLLERSKFISEGILPDHKAYYYGTPGSFPFVEENEGTSVTGEVFLIDSNTLADLDRLEGYRGINRDSFYLRKTANIITPDGVLNNVYYYCSNNHRMHIGDSPEVPNTDGVYTWSRSVWN